MFRFVLLDGFIFCIDLIFCIEGDLERSVNSGNRLIVVLDREWLCKSSIVF